MIDKNIISMQFHPEFNWTLVQYFIESFNEPYRSQILVSAEKTLEKGLD